MCLLSVAYVLSKLKSTVQWGPGPFPEIKLPGCNVDHPPPSSADVKNEWRNTPTPPYACMAWTGTALALTFT
jgi:hypothetical protein